MVLTVSFVLFPVTGFFATVIPKARFARPANLAPALERQNHTTSPYVTSTIV